MNSLRVTLYDDFDAYGKPIDHRLRGFMVTNPVPVHPRAQSASMSAARISSAYQRCPLTRPLRDSVSSDAPSTHADLLGGGEIHGLVVSQHVECKKKVIDSIARSQATDHVDLAQ
jgi:hypothetical protein